MMGQQPRTEPMFYYFRVEDQIPEHHLLRRIDRYIDFCFVRERLREANHLKHQGKTSEKLEPVGERHGLGVAPRRPT